MTTRGALPSRGLNGYFKNLRLDILTRSEFLFIIIIAFWWETRSPSAERLNLAFVLLSVIFSLGLERSSSLKIKRSDRDHSRIALLFSE